MGVGHWSVWPGGGCVGAGGGRVGSGGGRVGARGGPAAPMIRFVIV